MHSVQIHGWRLLPCGSQEYADFWSGEDCDGFCVYLHTNTPDNIQQPFDISEEADFHTIEAAENYALQLSLHRDCPVERY